MSFLRLRNTAGPEVLAKAFRAELPDGLQAHKYLEEDVVTVIDHFSSLMLAILRCTPRPTKECLRTASSIAFPKSANVNVFADRLYDGFLYCRAKSRTIKDGSRLPGAVRAIVKYMLKQQDTLKVPSSWEQEEGICKSKSSPLKPPSKTLGQKLKHAALKRMVSSPILPTKHGGSSGSKAFVQPTPLSRDAILASYTDVFGSDSEIVEVVASDEEASVPKPKLEHLDRSSMKMVRILSNGVRQEAKMQPSSTGFCVALFEGDMKPAQTEVPNLYHEPCFKRPAAKGQVAPRKKPAASKVVAKPAEASEGEEEEEVEVDPLASLPDTIVVKYSTPYRYPSGAWGIRRRFSNGDSKQLFQVKPAGFSDEQIKELCLEAIQKLKDGASEPEVTLYVKSK